MLGPVFAVAPGVKDDRGRKADKKQGKGMG